MVKMCATPVLLNNKSIFFPDFKGFPSDGIVDGAKISKRAKVELKRWRRSLRKFGGPSLENLSWIHEDDDDDDDDYGLGCPPSQ